MEAQAQIVEVIPRDPYSDRLFWMCNKTPPHNMPDSYYFCIDNVRPSQELQYEPFCNDFGPLNLGMTYRFCVELQKLMKNAEYKNCRIYHYTGTDPAKRVNAAFLMGAYQVLVLGKSGAEAWEAFGRVPEFPDFRDASFGACTYRCSVLHCLRGLEIASKLGWFNLSTFDISNYEKYERVENGDMNWIIPGKLLAFSSPSPVQNDDSGWRCFTPEDYVPLFKTIGVTTVVRLNKKTYDSSVRSKQRFARLGIRHYDLYFLDGSVPSEEIIQRFLSIAESEPGALAIHCKAGLGRTGTLIGIYAMKHFGFPPAEFIGWIRICRPGSVLGPQQQFLVTLEGKVQKWANEFRLEQALKLPRTEPSEMHTKMTRTADMSPEDQRKAIHGDSGQAERLLSAKKSNQSPSSAKTTPKRSPAPKDPPKSGRSRSLGPISPPAVKKPSSKTIFAGQAVVLPAPKGVKAPAHSFRASRKGPLLT